MDGDLQRLMKKKGTIQQKLLSRNAGFHPTPDTELVELRSLTASINRLRRERGV